MSDWRKKPTLIDEWEETIDYVMAIDENGTTDLQEARNLMGKTLLDRINTANNKEKFLHERWFTITGVAIHRENFESFKDKINSIKYAYWSDGIYDYKQGERRVVFHSREIRKKEGPFNPKLINIGGLAEDISSMIKNTDFTIYSSSIDKILHTSRYARPYHVYNLCLNFIVERFCRMLNSKGKCGILLLESRGKVEDAQILEFLIDLIQNGNNFHSSGHFNCIKGIYFNPKWCLSKNKGRASFILLELADLVSFPIYKYVKTGRKDLAFEALESKLQNYPSYNGYGIKIFP